MLPEYRHPEVRGRLHPSLRARHPRAGRGGEKMKRVRTLLRGRSLLVLTAMAIVALGALVATAPTAEAISGPAICTYYNNAAHKKVVGTRGTGCCGEPISWGITTLYFHCEQLLCPQVICPN
jgi:uncharacterized protein DUF6289